MIVVKLQGGLGNQLFQWSCGLGLSKKFNKDFFLDLNFYNNQTGNTFRNFSLTDFPFFNYKKFEGINTEKIHLTDNFIFNNFDCSQNKVYYLDGYWQSEKYFSNIRPLILDYLRPTEDFFKKIKNLNFFEKNYVSLHVRRGDYVSLPNYHPLQTIEYYKNAIDRIGNNDGLLIFSDDILWCKENFKFENMNFIEGYSDVENIWMMSMCKHNIIANSSFSWWGAWLNDNENKIVITPKNWFGVSLSNITSNDIIPNNWFKI